MENTPKVLSPEEILQIEENILGGVDSEFGPTTEEYEVLSLILTIKTNLPQYFQ
jgi:hypothetical protein